MDKILKTLKKFIPRKIFKFFQPAYHYLLALTGTIIYKYPSRNIHVVAITGTKGKSSTTEYVNAVLEEAGYKTAILSTIRFKIGDHNRPNLYKMTMPGRFFVQKFLREAVNNQCEYAIIEMTSEGARFYRHLGVELDTLIFTNLTPEHIDSHGSFENYKNAKLKLVKSLAKSKKPLRRSIANVSDPHGHDFLIYNVDKNIGYSKDDAKDLQISLPGEFNKMNALAAATFARSIGIGEDKIKRALLNVIRIPGRADEVTLKDIKSETPNTDKLRLLKNIKVVVDYAHTQDSLEKIYSAYPGTKIGVLGACGGGRDKDKREKLGETADKNCDLVIVTDEDPYDDEPIEIINDVAKGVKNKELSKNLFMELDRRSAIKMAIEKATEMVKTKPNVTVILSGKGTDPYIMLSNGKKENWSDREVVIEELEKYLAE